jgi:sec-independent protein translocase protein TatB
MIGISWDKVVLLLLVAAFVIGPARLPGMVQRLATVVRQAQSFAQRTKERVREEVGEDIDLEVLDPRRYDPRRIITDALRSSPSESQRLTADEERG